MQWNANDIEKNMRSIVSDDEKQQMDHALSYARYRLINKQNDNNLLSIQSF